MKSKEVDLLEISRLLYRKKRTLILGTFLSFSVGIVVAFGSGTEYLSKTVLIADSESAAPDIGNLQGLAGLAGMSFDLGGSQLLPLELYPEIGNSIEYKLELINSPIYFQNLDSTVSSYDFFEYYYSDPWLSKIAEYTIGLPRKIYHLLKGKETGDKDVNNRSDILTISKKQSESVKKFSRRIIIDVDDELNTVSISGQMPDPVASAELTEKAKEILQRLIIDFKIKKSKQELEFVQERYSEAKKEFEIVQRRLAILVDQNKNVNTSLAKIELDIAQNKYDIAFEIYRGLTTQLEKAEIGVKKETPVFSVLEPVVVPNERTGASKPFILTFFSFLGFVLSIAFLIVKDPIRIFVSKIKN